MNITLKPIDESNFLDAFHLQLRDDQTQYVSHPIRSLAQAYVYRDQCQPFGIYADGGIRHGDLRLRRAGIRHLAHDD